MSIILQGIHTAPDIWVALQQHRTGFQMLTPRAKKWAAEYREPESSDLDKMLWVPSPIGSEIMQDIEHQTSLNVLLDDWERPIND
jgi:hypothetical protein